MYAEAKAKPKARKPKIEVVVEHHYPTFVKKHRFEQPSEAIQHIQKHAGAVLERDADEDGE